MNQKIPNIQIINSLLWKFLERGGSQGINFIIIIVLARILTPEEYGLIAIISVLINLANVLVQSGLNTALIQKKNADDTDFSTIFYLSIIFAGLLYIILFFLSPKIAIFYDKRQLVTVLRVLSLTLFLGAFNSIQIAFITRNMQFKILFYSSIGAIIISGSIGIVMAKLEFGVWALVGQQLSFQAISPLIMWFTVKWRPKLRFSFNSLKELFTFGYKILLSNLLITLFQNIRSLIIGKIYSPEILGYFDRGKHFPAIIITNINSSIQTVMLPVYSSEQDDPVRVKKMVRRSITTSALIIFPIMIGLAVIAKPLVLILLTEKWLPSVPFIQIFCATYMLMPIHSANLEAIKALGYSNEILKIEIIKKVIEVIVLIISIQYGVYVIALGTFITSFVSLLINSYPNIKLLNYSYKEQLKDIAPILVSSIIMGIIVFGLSFFIFPIVYRLILQILIGGMVYIYLIYVFKIESYTYLVNSAKTFKNNKH